MYGDGVVGFGMDRMGFVCAGVGRRRGGEWGSVKKRPRSRRTPVAVKGRQDAAREMAGSDSAMYNDGVFSEGPLLPPRLVRSEEERRRITSTRVGNALTLTGLFAAWYISNTVFNVYNKQVLAVYPYPLTCTLLQFLVASVMMSALWVFRLRRAPVINWDSVKTLISLSSLHAAGFYLTNASLGSVSVAFTHTVKATEPFFSVALSPILLGEIPTWGVVGTLLPIVFGVGLASATEASFTWLGFLSAMGSNVALQSRNVLSKRFMKKGESSIDNINLFALITIGAFLFLLPISGLEVATSLPALWQSSMGTTELLRKTFIGGALRCIDVLSSYMILKRVSPVSHSVGNCVKRAVVISSSVVFFHATISPLNAIGTAIALLGVLFYSLVVVGCKQNKFGPDSPLCRPVYEELELVEGAGI